MPGWTLLGLTGTAGTGIPRLGLARMPELPVKASLILEVRTADLSRALISDPLASTTRCKCGGSPRSWLAACGSTGFNARNASTSGFGSFGGGPIVGIAIWTISDSCDSGTGSRWSKPLLRGFLRTGVELSSEALRDLDFRRLLDLPFFSFPLSLLFPPFLEGLLLLERLFFREELLLEPPFFFELLRFLERLRLPEELRFLASPPFLELLLWRELLFSFFLFELSWSFLFFEGEDDFLREPDFSRERDRDFRRFLSSPRRDLERSRFFLSLPIPRKLGDPCATSRAPAAK